MSGQSEISKITINVGEFARDGYPISRSMARRMMTACVGFDHVTLDFVGLELNPSSWSFLDEVFRVWARFHPETKIDVAGATDSLMSVITVKQRQLQKELQK